MIGGEIVKGVILAGGVGSRLTPLTEITNKHLLPVGKEPMLWHPARQDAGTLESLVETGQLLLELGNQIRT